MTPVAAADDCAAVLAAVRARQTTRAGLRLRTGLPEDAIAACLGWLESEGWIWSAEEPYRPVPAAYREFAVRRRARILLAGAVQRGEVRQPDQCAHCRARADDAKLYGYHVDHRKPLEALWLCVSCHQAAERGHAGANPSAKRRGRPVVPTVKVNVKLPEHVYDAYCRRALARRESLHTVLRRTLIAHI